MTKLQVRNILLLVLAIIVIILLVKVFRGSGNSDVDKQLQAAMEVIKAKDETIKAVQGERDAYKLVGVEKDKSIVAHLKTDSLIEQAIKNNQPKYISNEKKYTDIPKHVNDLDHDALLREIADY